MPGRSVCAHATTIRAHRYHQTKLANPVFAMALHSRLQTAGSAVKSLCVEPGGAATALGSNLRAGHKRRAAEKGAPPPASPRSGGGGGAGKAKKAAAKKTGAKSKRPAFKLQSGADGACPLILASFAPDAESGDMYMPSGGSAGYPVKCITRGVPTPTSEDIRKRFGNEVLTMHPPSRAMLWAASEAATGVRFAVGAARL